MSKVEFALFSPQAGQTTKAIFERATLCEKLAYHSIWLVDHFWTRGMPDLDHVEALTMMAGLAARTEFRVVRRGTDGTGLRRAVGRLGQPVAGRHHRHACRDVD